MATGTTGPGTLSVAEVFDAEEFHDTLATLGVTWLAQGAPDTVCLCCRDSRRLAPCDAALFVYGVAAGKVDTPRQRESK